MTEPSGPSDFINDVDDGLLRAQPLTVSRLHVEEVSALIEALGPTSPEQVDRVVTAVERIVRSHENEVFDDALERGDPVDLQVRLRRRVEDVELPEMEEED